MNKTPKLRFKEFSGDWESKKLGEVGEVVTGNTPSTSDKDNYGKEYLWASPADLGNLKYIKSTVKMLSSKGFSKVRNVPKGSILVTCIGSTIGKIGVANEEMSSNQQINTLVCNKNLNNEFGYYSIHYNFPKYLSYVTSQAVPIINKSQFQDFTIKVTSLKEQEKIASFFSLIDDKISLQGEKVDALKDYKKGMMQKIFSRELRFKDDDGRDYPEWAHKKLNSIVERVTRKNKGIQSTLPLTISAQYGLVDQITFFNKTVASTNLEGYYLLEKGEFAYNKSYSTGYPFGAIKRLDNYDKGVLSSLYICFAPLENMDSDFLLQYFESTYWHKEISMIAVEGARNHGLLNISVSDFFETYHWIPCYDEQVKIGKFLGKIDEKVAKEQEKLDSLNEYKKGLLQQMFV